MSNTDDNPLFQNLPGKSGRSKPASDEPDEPAEVKEIKQTLAHHKVVEPLPSQTGREEAESVAGDNKSAIDMLRNKIDALYSNSESSEPSAKEEIKEIDQLPEKKLSKHQRFMLELSSSGKSLADIQTQWHRYYTELPDDEKHAVWQEFYAEHEKHSESASKPKARDAQDGEASVHGPQQTPHHVTTGRQAPKAKPSQDLRSVKEVKEQLLGKVKSRARSKKQASHLRSLAFGLGMGSLVMLFTLFGFFNERIIAPFITPSRTVSSTPIIVDPNSTKVGPEPLIIIPKINVEIPVVYNEPSVQEAAVQKALERGVLHYATTTKPGEIGNGVIFGHSSNNILNKGDYKFAFVLLSRMEKGDTFMLHKDGKRYVYKVFDKKIVPPTDLSVLGKTSKPSTFTLITCDPPGTSINRLVVTGEQISPDPKANVASTASKSSSATNVETLPSNSPSLWQRFTDWLAG